MLEIFYITCIFSSLALCSMLKQMWLEGMASDVKMIWNFSKGDYDKARKLAASTDWKGLLNGKSSDMQYNNFVSRMNYIRSVCIPQKTVHNSRTHDKLWFNSTARRLVNKKNKAWKTYMRAKRLNKPNKCLLYDRYLKQQQKTSRRV